MAQIRDYKSAISGTGGSFALTMPAVAPGDVLIVCHSCDTGSTGQMQISGTGWTDAVAPLDSSGLFTRVWMKSAGPSEPATVTLYQASNADGVGAILSLSAAQYNPADSWSGVDTSNNTTVVNIGTLGDAGDVALIWTAGAGGGSPKTWAEPPGWSPLFDGQSGNFTVACLVSMLFGAGGDTGLATFTLSGDTPIAHTIVMRVRNSITDVAVNGSDTAAVGEQANVRAVLARSDSAAVVDTGQAARLVSEQGAVAETSAVTASAQRTDTAVVSDIAAAAGTASRAETAAASETVQITSTTSRADTGVLSESAAVALTASDYGALVDTSSKQETLGPVTSDAASTVEAATLAAAVAGGDFAALEEMARIDVGRSASESATVLDQAVAGPLTGESVSAAETASVTVLITRADSLTAADTAVAGQPVGASDSAGLAETALVVDLGNEITGVDGPHRSWGAELAPRGWGAEPPACAWSAYT
ncbi:hypothetical protein HII36_05495 [Nonomuraea sp. NN258]|uniref:hypothetical protein n=1 Tax=Nonomuraea antri TaxID=2730852 RepID=UPI001569129E|nr:hypothetical protein [Nonomuraea antri]NRQ31292.1 hypothetical protein [Nonomuraea antri]